MTMLDSTPIMKCGERSIRKPCSGCGRTDLWWAHSTESDGGHKSCHKHGLSGISYVLMESDGKRHACKSDDRHQPEPDETSVSEIRCSECGELEANGHYSFCSRSQTPKPVSPTPS